MSQNSEKPAKKRRKKPTTKIGRQPGQMRPFTPDQIATLEKLLIADDSTTGKRDYALLRVGVCSMLRSVDLLGLTVGEVCKNGAVVSEFTVTQKKTGRSVSCDLLPQTQKVLRDWLDELKASSPSDRVFAICARQYQRIVKQWCEMLNIDGATFSTHSIRKTKASLVYANTKNIKAVSHLLGHANTRATEAYLGVSVGDAREISRGTNI